MTLQSGLTSSPPPPCLVLPAFAVVHRPPGGHSSPGPRPPVSLLLPALLYWLVHFSSSPSVAFSIFGPLSERPGRLRPGQRGGRAAGRGGGVGDAEVSMPMCRLPRRVAPRGATACAQPSVTPPPPGMASCGGRALNSLSQSTSKRGGDKGKTPLPSLPACSVTLFFSAFHPASKTRPRPRDPLNCSLLPKWAPSLLFLSPLPLSPLPGQLIRLPPPLPAGLPAADRSPIASPASLRLPTATR